MCHRAHNNDVLFNKGMLAKRILDGYTTLLIRDLFISKRKQLSSDSASESAGDRTELALVIVKFLRGIDGYIVILVACTEIKLRTKNITKLFGET